VNGDPAADHRSGPETLEVAASVILCITSERSCGRERKVNEKEIEKLMARYEPRLVRFLYSW